MACRLRSNLPGSFARIQPYPTFPMSAPISDIIGVEACPLFLKALLKTKINKPSQSCHKPIRSLTNLNKAKQTSKKNRNTNLVHKVSYLPRRHSEHSGLRHCASPSSDSSTIVSTEVEALSKRGCVQKIIFYPIKKFASANPASSFAEKLGLWSRRPNKENRSLGIQGVRKSSKLIQLM